MAGTQLPEIDLISKIPRHTSIVKYYGWFTFQYHGWLQLECYAVVGMELCVGNLGDYLNSLYQRNYSLHDMNYIRWYIVQGIAEGLHQCHSIQLMHRDIKPENSSLLN